MYDIWYATKFKKDLKRIIKRGHDITELETVINILANGKPLAKEYEDHILSGNWKGYRECHIQPDWLLIYKIDNNALILTLTRTGTHSDLF